MTISTSPRQLRISEESPFSGVMSQLRKLINLISVLMMAVLMVMIMPVYLLVLEDKADYESRCRLQRFDDGE